MIFWRIRILYLQAINFTKKGINNIISMLQKDSHVSSFTSIKVLEFSNQKFSSHKYTYEVCV